MTFFDPIRREELRIMGYADVSHNGENPLERMAREITVAGPVTTSGGIEEAQVGDLLIEFADGTVELVAPDVFTQTSVLMPLESTEASIEPVPLAEPVGLLQREEATSDAD